MTPKLTLARWTALKKIGRIEGETFIASSHGIAGATMLSLEQCGWVARVEEPTDQPFTVATQGAHWTITEAGRAAIAALPETAPRRM